MQAPGVVPFCFMHWLFCPGRSTCPVPLPTITLNLPFNKTLVKVERKGKREGNRKREENKVRVEGRRKCSLVANQYALKRRWVGALSSKMVGALSSKVASERKGPAKPFLGSQHWEIPSTPTPPQIYIYIQKKSTRLYVDVYELARTVKSAKISVLGEVAICPVK